MTLKRLTRIWMPSARRRRLRADDEGFTIIEVVSAVGIFAIVMLLLSAMLAGGMRGVLLGKKREVATQEASRMLEYARSLSYDAVGLAQTDTTIASDPAITTVGGIKVFAVDGVGTFEPILWATNPTGHPYNPHVRNVTRGASALTSYVYVTGVDTDGDGAFDMKRITTRVVFSESGTAGARNEVRAQTYVDENGVVPVGTGPTGSPGSSPTPCPAGGCITGRAPMSGTALSAGGTMSIRSAHGSLATLTSAVLPSDPLVASLPNSSGKTKLRAVAGISCKTEPTWIQGGTTYGQHPQTQTADDDSLTMTPENHPSKATWSGSPADAISGGGEADRLIVESSLSSSASCHASAKDSDGVAPTDDGLPLEQGTGSGPSTLNLTEGLTGAGLPSDLLTVLSTTGVTNAQHLDHRTVGPSREIESSASGSLGKIQVGKIPSVFPNGLVEINAFDYSVTATASEGTPSAAPTVAVPSGITVSIFDPSSSISGCSSRNGQYCVLTINPVGAGFTGLSRSIDSSLTQNLGLTVLDYEVNVQAFPPRKDPAAGIPDGSATTWSASYNALSVSVSLTIDVNVLGTNVRLTATEVDLQLGTASAWTCGGVGCDAKVTM